MVGRNKMLEGTFLRRWAVVMMTTVTDVAAARNTSSQLVWTS